MIAASAPFDLAEAGAEARAERPTVLPSKRLCFVWRTSMALLGLQLIGMLLFSAAQYNRFNLTNDFAAYSQAWTAIARGNLDPSGTVWPFPFWRNDLELLMWPLALGYWVYPHTVTLLWLQDAAVVGSELVALVWARDIIRSRRGNDLEASWLLALVTLLLVLTPWSWYTIGFDFHFEAFTALFGLLAARSLWAGRYRGLLLWLPLTLLSCAAAGALLAIALGLVSLVSRGVARRVALAVLVVGVGWLTLAASLGAMRFGGLHLGAMYGYLSANPREQFGLPNLLGGLVANPVRAFDMFNTNVGYVAGYIASAGVIGLWSRWGLLVGAIVLLPSSINADPDFIHFAQAFQSWPAVVFLVVACVLTLQRLAGKAVHSHRVIYVFGGCSVALAATVTGLFVGHIPSYIERVSPAAARELSGLQRHIPAGAEVIASQGVIGRFGAGHVAFSYWGTGLPETYAVVASPVIFILAPVQGTAEGIPEATRQAITYVGTRLGARVVLHDFGVWAYAWEPTRGTSSVVLP